MAGRTRTPAGPVAAALVLLVALGLSSPGSARAATLPADPAVVVAVADVLRPPRTAADPAPGVPVVDTTGAADRPVLSASLVKLLLADELLHRASTGERALTGLDSSRIEAMLTRSDAGAASALWWLHDGSQRVRDVAARYGLTGTRPPDDPTQWGETVTTAADLARYLAALPVRATARDGATLLDLLRAAAPRAADGFDQRFGLLAVPGTGQAAVKQGWMCCLAGTRQLHSIGVVGGRAVVLLGEFPAGTRWTAAVGRLDAAARAVLAG